MKSDYLKYWKVIRYFIRAKYGLSAGDLDMLLFLYSEEYFDKEKFKQFNTLMGWNRGTFERLRQQGWIEVFRKRNKNKKSIYCLSYKTKRVIKLIYNKLEGEELAVDASTNPMFLKNVSYSDKVYRNMILEMNKFIRQQRHHSEK